jgi:hypothetical protein
LKRYFIFLLILLASCTFLKKKTERVLARVHDEYLYESDLKGVVPEGTTATDSITLTKNYIDSWVRKKLLIHQAESNLADNQKDFTRQLEEYRSSLVVYAYENELVRQKLDTLVSDEEIEAYYQENSGNFLLKDNIVQLQYIKLPKDASNINAFKKLLRADDPASRERLSKLCEKNAVDYFLDDQNWLLFTDVLKEVPVKTYNREEYLKNHTDIEYYDSAYAYLIRIRDFKIKESVSPLSFEKDRIRNILLNKRKMDLINGMREDVYNTALRKNDFEVY